MNFDICLLTFDILRIDYRYVMKNNAPTILKGIRAAFLGFRWLFVLCLIGILIQFVKGPSSVTATVGLAVDSSSTIHNTEALAAPIQLDALKADVKITVNDTATAELKTLARLATLPSMLIAACAGLVLCEIGQRLIKNLETGELFSNRNLGLLRGFAIVLIAGTVIQRLLVGWGNQAFGQYAAAHLTFAGGRVLAVADHVGVAELRLNLGGVDLLVGLLLLLIVWAFKEGAALKRESDLTV
jgi:hypothetical protein